MKKHLIHFFLAATLLINGSFNSAGKPADKTYATCKGENPCRACKNCRYCKRCAKNGLTCGVCKK